MTVAALTATISYNENGITLNFAVPFRYLDATHLVVTRTAANGTQTVLAYGAAWTATPGPTDAGGTLTLAASIAGCTLTIERRTPRNQATDYVANDRFPAETHEATVDRAMLIDQEQDAVLARALLLPTGEAAPGMPAAAQRLGKFLGFDPLTGMPVVVAGSATADMAMSTFVQPGVGNGAVPRTALAKLRDLVSPLDFGCVGDGITNDTANLAWAISFATLFGWKLDGGGRTYLVSGLVATIGNLHIDNMTVKEAAPNVGDPVTIKFQAAVAGKGHLYMGPGFKVDRSGNGLAGTLNVSCGIYVTGVAIVLAHCEIYGNARGSGLLVEYARWFRDESYVHDMLCDHTGVVDDIQHGSWARYCDNVITGGLVHTLGRIDRSTIQRDRYNRGRAYSGCTNLLLGGSVGPGVDQAYDVTGNARGGNTCVKLCGAHADYPYSVGFKFANAVLAASGNCATVREPGLAGVIVSGPDATLLNMTSAIIISGITQIGGGANGQWADRCLAKLDRNTGALPGRAYPKGVIVTGNVLADFHGNASTFTIGDASTLAPTPSAPLNVHKGARVRLTTTGVLPAGLAINTDYYVTITEQSNIKLSTSFVNCLDGVYISSFAGGSGTHTITAQRDVDWGVYSNVDSYDAALPNLVYGNRFGGVPSASPSVQAMQASATAAGPQSVSNALSNFANGSSKTDPYGICDLTGGTSASVMFTTPFDGDWEFNVTGLWTGGAGTGSCQMFVQLDTTGGGFVDVPEANEVMRYPTGDTTQTVRWCGFLPKGSKIQTKIFQSDGAPRNFQLRGCTLRLLPR